jgi:hypothetical protein
MSLLVLTFTSAVFAQSPAKLYLQVLESCGAGAKDKKVVWLGTTNYYGPGTIWTLDGGPQLKVPSNRYFKTQADLDAAMGLPAGQHSNPCGPDKSPQWKVGADVPISVAGVGNGEVSLSLSKATTVIATATSVSWVEIPQLTMEDAINALSHNDTAFWRIADGRSYAMLNAYSVQGLQITYTLDSALTAGAKASVQATPAVNVGTAASPVTASVSVSDNGQKVVISVPDAHWAFGEMTPVGLMPSNVAQNKNSRLMLGKKAWIATCKETATCNAPTNQATR